MLVGQSLGDLDLGERLLSSAKQLLVVAKALPDLLVAVHRASLSRGTRRLIEASDGRTEPRPARAPRARGGRPSPATPSEGTVKTAIETSSLRPRALQRARCEASP